MSDTIEAVIRRVVSAMAHARPDDVIDGVKTAVADSLHQVDPSTKVTFTNYFNHTYNPDMTVRWLKGEVTSERPIFLRASLSTAVESQDLPALAQQSPIVIGLKPEKKRVLETLRPQVRQSGGALTAEMSSLAALSEQTSSATNRSSLATLVRSNLLREGRGFLDTKGAARIADVDRRSGAASARALQETVDELFVGQAGVRLSKTAALLSAIFDAAKVADVVKRLVEEPLSDAELAVILPEAVLGAAEVAPAIWEALGASISLGRIEGMATALTDLDLTPLIAPNVRRIGAARALLELNAHLVEEEEAEAIADIARWRLRERRLAAELGNLILYIVSDGRKLRLPGEGVSARWDEIGDNLEGLELMSVALHGLSDQFNVASAEPARVQANVDALRSAIQDEFHVPQVRVREDARELDGTVQVDFEAMRIDRATGDPSLRAFVLSTPLLARRTPIPQRLLDVVLGTDLGANDEPDKDREQSAGAE